MRPLFVFVEGNIGSGKSTLLRAVEKFAWDAADNVAVVVVFEQVSSWVNVGGTDLLKAMYDDPARYSGLFQRTVLTSRAKAIEDALAPYAGTDKTVVVFCERSMWSGRNVFARMLHDTGKMDDTEYASYLQYYDWHFTKLYGQQAELMLFLDCAPHVCFERVQQRGRAQERRTVDEKYLQSLDKAYYRALYCSDAGVPAKALHVVDAENVACFDTLTHVKQKLQDTYPHLFKQ